MQHDMEGRKILVRVLAVNLLNREVHCRDKHGGNLIAAYRQTPVIQQIPASGEVWTIEMRDWHWLMDARIEEIDEQARTAGLAEGDLHLKVKTNLYLNDGKLGYGTYDQFVVDGIQTVVVLTTPSINPKAVRVYDSGGLLVDPSTVTIGADGITLTFASPPAAGKITIYYSRI